MPSASEERRARVVTEIDSVRSSALSCSSMRVSVVLPAPEGEERIRIIPRRRMRPRSFDVLHLLAQLLDMRAQFEPLRRQRSVVRLGAQGIGLAPELLGQKIQA